MLNKTSSLAITALGLIILERIYLENFFECNPLVSSLTNQTEIDVRS